MKTLLTIYFYFNKIFRSNSCDFYKIKSWLFTLGVITLGTAISWGQGNEDFTNIPTNNNNNNSSYLTRSWTGSDGDDWNATHARTDLTLNGRAICTRNPGNVESPVYTGGIGNITLTTKRAFGGGSGDLSVKVNGDVVGTVPYSESEQTSTITGVNISGSVTVVIENSSSDRVIIDDISWTPYVSGPSYNIIFNPNGGSGTMPNQTIVSGATANLNSNTFTRTGYVFAGWSTSASGAVVYADNDAYTMGGTDVTLYAQWTPTYDVIFDPNGGSGTMPNQTIVSGTTANLNSNTFTRTGYVFAGWSTSASGAVVYADNDAYTMGGADVTLYAQWTPTYDVIFDPNGGSGTMTDQTIVSGATANLNSNTFTRTGYVFAGWSTSASGAVVYADNDAYTMGGTDVTLYAQWTPTYDVIFDPNGGSGTMPNQTIVSGATANLNSNTFTRTGYVFAGWSTSASGAVVYADNDAYTMGGTDVTLYAQWDVYVGPCFSMNGPDFPNTSYTWSGDTDSGGSPTNTIRLASNKNAGSISTTATGVTAGDVTVKFRAKGWDGDETQVTVTVDGNSQFISDLDDNAFTERTLIYSSVSTDPIIEFSTASGKRVHIGNVEIICEPIVVCTPTASITSFLPNSGPAGTIITITGSGFTGTTDVKFGTVDATSFTIVDDNTITAEVPAGIGNSETISVFDASACEEVSVDTYSLTTLSGACSAYPGYTDLFMSEVYDHSPGDGWYLELYNPTSSPILLTGVYQIERYGNLDLTGNPNLIDLVGTVPPMSVFVIQLHSVNRCTGLAVDFQTLGDWGINENDRIRLVKNGTVVDDVSTPNNRGYTIKRDINPSGVAPSDVYPTEGWTTGPNDCSDLGFFTLPPATNIDVTSPTDVSGCSLNMSVTSTTPGVTYSWKFNDPTTNTWLDVNSANLPGVTITGETTSNLSITGDLAFMEDFQFYCEVSESGCSSASDAAQFNTDSRPIYRSVAGSNGVWSDYTNWEMSYDYITYVPACTYPRDINSSEVIIQAGTYIRLDLTGTDDVTIDKVTIENTGTLEIEANAQLTVNNSVAASDFIVNGTLFDRTNATNVMVFVTGATWELGANGTVIKSNESDVDFYRDVYEGGMANIPATADWIYRFNNDGDPTVGTIDFFYPNLSFENTTATAYSFGGNFNSFNGSTGFATVKGDFDIGVTGSSTCLVSNTNFNVQPMLVYGNMHVDNGSGLVNYNTATTEFGTGFELKGDLLVNGTLSVLSGTTERVFRFTGTTDQTVSGAGVIDLFKVTVNKATGNILLNRDLQVQNELVMAQGHIFTNTSLLELGLSTTQKGILNHTNDYVVGRMRRWFDGTNFGDQTGLYPMGYDDGGLKNRNTKIEFTTAPTAGGDLTVEFIGLDMTYAGLIIPAGNSGGFGSDITNAEDQGYWTCTAGSLSGGTYTSSYTGEGFSQIISLLDITLLKRQNASSPWTAPGVHIPAAGTTGLPTVSRSGLTGFSDFGFGSRNNENPLPINLTSFSAVCDDKNESLIQWTTATETNNDYFVIEKSTDGKEWNLVEEIQGKGNYNFPSNYSIKDRNTSNFVTYYRLTQVDFNGDTETFHPISLVCQATGVNFQVFPNPANDFTTVSLQGYNFQNATLDLRTIEGKLIQRNLVLENTNSIHLNVNLNGLSQGIYLLHWTDGNGEKEVRKIVVK